MPVRPALAAVLVVSAASIAGGTILATGPVQLAEAPSATQAEAAPGAEATQPAAPLQALSPRRESGVLAADAGVAAAERFESLERRLERVAAEQSLLISTVDRIAQSLTTQTLDLNPHDELLPEEADIAESERMEREATAIEDALSAEHVDVEWATEAQHSIVQAFDSEPLSAMDIVASECRASLCRVELSISHGVDESEAFRSLSQNRPWNGPGFVQVSGDPPQVVLFLAREGLDLPEVDHEDF